MTSTSGRPLTDYQVTRIVVLLTTTDMSFTEIARRMECSRSTIASVNRKYAVRDYAGRRSSWKIEEPALIDEPGAMRETLRRLA